MTTVSEVGFDLGDEFVPHQHLTGIPTRRRTWGSCREQMFGEWPEFCQDVGLAITNTRENKLIPRLIDWHRDGHFEVFDVEMCGRFVERIDLLGEVLLSSRHAMSESTIEVRPGVVRVVLNYLELPVRLPFTPDRMPSSRDRVYLGHTTAGEDLVWDLTENAHGLIVGANGSGKSEAAALVLTQLHLKGWDLLILTPTTDDTTFQGFTEAGHTVIAGATETHFIAARDAVLQRQHQVTVREGERAAAGDDWYQGTPSMIAIDECGDWLVVRKTDSDVIRECKQTIQAVVDQRARRGRKIRDHLLLFTQEPYVANFGTPETLRQLLFRLAVTALDRTFHPIVFQPSGDTVSPNVRRVLSNPRSPKGRGISRGGHRTNNNEYAIVDDVPTQVAWLPKEQRLQLLNGQPIQPAAPDPPPPPITSQAESEAGIEARSSASMLAPLLLALVMVTIVIALGLVALRSVQAGL